MKTWRAWLATACGVCAVAANAAVEPVIFQVDSFATYTVPPGKVLLIDSVYVADDIAVATTNNPISLPYNGTASLRIVSGTTTQNVALAWLAREKGQLINGEVRLSCVLPLRVPSGTLIGSWADSISNPTIMVFGRLVDPEDLFASVIHSIDDLSINGGELQLGLQFDVARPVKVKVEGADVGLASWEPVPALISSVPDRSRREVQFPAPGDHRLIRTSAVPR